MGSGVNICALLAGLAAFAFVMDQLLELNTYFHAPIPIHSPPVGS